MSQRLSQEIRVAQRAADAQRSAHTVFAVYRVGPREQHFTGYCHTASPHLLRPEPGMTLRAIYEVYPRRS